MEYKDLSLLLISADESLLTDNGRFGWYASIASCLRRLVVLVPSKQKQTVERDNVIFVPLSKGLFQFLSVWRRIRNLAKRNSIDGIVYEQESLKYISKLAAFISGKKMMMAESGKLPIMYDFRPFWKQASYKPTVTPLHYYVAGRQSNNWGEDVVKALAAGMTVIMPSDHPLSSVLTHNVHALTYAQESEAFQAAERLRLHPEEAYRLAKNGQMWVKQELNQRYLPQLLVRDWANQLMVS